MQNIVETHDLEELTEHLANELSSKVGNPQLVRQEFFKLYSSLKSVIGSRVNDAQTAIVERYRNPRTEELQGDSRQLQVELYHSLSNF